MENTTLKRLPNRPCHENFDLKWEQSIQASRLFGDLLDSLDAERREVAEMLSEIKSQEQFNHEWFRSDQCADFMRDLEARLEVNLARRSQYCKLCIHCFVLVCLARSS